MKIPKQPIPQEPRTEKLVISGEQFSLLEAYANYYEESYHQKISLQDLILEILSVFIKSDRDFKQWARNNPFSHNQKKP